MFDNVNMLNYVYLKHFIFTPILQEHLYIVSNIRICLYYR